MNYEKSIPDLVSLENEKKEKQELFSETTVYINAGGRGSRLEPIMQKTDKGIVKALIEFSGEPMIKKHVDLLSKLGFKGIIVGAGDHNNIKDYFSEKDNSNVLVIGTDNQEDTGGDLIKAIRELTDCGKNVLVENVDTIVYIRDLEELLRQHQQNKAMATIVLTTRKGVPNEGAFYVDSDQKVVFTKEAESLNLEEPVNWNGFRGSSTGVVVFDSDFLRSYQWKSGDGKLSIYRDIIPRLVETGDLYAFDNEDNIFVDTGTPDKYYQIKRRENKIFNALGDKYLRQ